MTNWERAIHSIYRACLSLKTFISLCVCVSFPFDFMGWLWDLIVLVPDHCLSFDCAEKSFYETSTCISVPAQRKK